VNFGLYYYGARWYDPAIGHFVQADTIVPNASYAGDYHRYAYTRFNPLKYTDPTGHACSSNEGLVSPLHDDGSCEGGTVGELGEAAGSLATGSRLQGTGVRSNSYAVQPKTVYNSPASSTTSGNASIRLNSWNEFQKATKGQFSSRQEAAAAYRRLYNDQDPWPEGYVPPVITLQPGARFQMAYGPGQKLQEPGGWGTLDHIKDSSYVRQQLAVTEQFKSSIDRVVTFEVVQPLQVKIGPVGPQIDRVTGQYLPGGGSQIQLMVPRDNRMQYIQAREVRYLVNGE
jgi:RHS repeat-associated protein